MRLIKRKRERERDRGGRGARVKCEFTVYINRAEKKNKRR